MKEQKVITQEEAIKRLKESRFTIQPYNYMNQALDMAISALEKQISMKPVFVHPLQFDDWIPCKERLPEEGVPVNITYKNSNPPSYYSNIKNIPFTATAISYKNKWYWYSCICLDILNEYGKNEADAVNKDIDIIAWQPLPEPYREEQEDGR